MSAQPNVSAMQVKGQRCPRDERTQNRADDVRTVDRDGDENVNAIQRPAAVGDCAAEWDRAQTHAPVFFADFYSGVIAYADDPYDGDQFTDQDGDH